MPQRTLLGRKQPELARDTNERINPDRLHLHLHNCRELQTDEISELLVQALQPIEDLGQRGEDTAQLEALYAQAQDNWREDQYLYQEAKPRLERIIQATEHWDEIQGMVDQATDCIETLKAEGNTRDAAISTADYDRALKAWTQYEYYSTHGSLEKITAKCPEPIFSFLGIILLPALLRHR